MKNILILMGSPRKNGNTAKLCKSFCDGAQKFNHIEIVNVTDYNVKPCTGCNFCLSSKQNACAQSDDMSKIIEKLKIADVLVIASPVYFYGISAQLKTIVDRLHTPIRNTFNIKETALLCVAGATLPQVFDSIKVQFKLINDFFKLNEIGSIFVDGVRNDNDILNNPKLNDSYNLGLSIK